MTPEEIEKLPYRPCVGLMIVNADGDVFVGQRVDRFKDAWQMPQGGIDAGEDVTTAALRELEEETGITPDLVEIEAETATKMQEYMQKKMAGEDVKMPDFKTNDEASLTLVRPVFDDEAAAMSAFDSSMKMLSEGVSASHEGVTATVQADITPVNGIGDKAMWAAKMRQLSVVSGRQIIHVGVRTGAGAEADLATAQAMASDLLGKL